MADAIESNVNLADRATLVNLESDVDADEVNTTRGATQNAVNNLNDIVKEQDKNYASSTAPTLKSEGKIWADTTNDPAVLKYYKDGANNDEELTGNTLTQSLTNKTYTNPTFSPAGGNGYLFMKRDVNIVCNENSVTPQSQVDFSADSLTLFSDTGLAVIETSISVTLNIAASGAGGRAIDVTQEGAATEQADTVYYLHIYSNGSGTVNGILSTQSHWANVAVSDKPSGSTYTRTVSIISNDGSSNIRPFVQKDNVYIFSNTASIPGSGISDTQRVDYVGITDIIDTTSINTSGSVDLTKYMPNVKYVNSVDIISLIYLNLSGSRVLGLAVFYNDTNAKETQRSFVASGDNGADSELINVLFTEDSGDYDLNYSFNVNTTPFSSNFNVALKGFSLNFF